MKNQPAINTTKIVYPQIYAYTLPTEKEDLGWIKIGYTERKNVDDRIKEQTHTAAIRLTYSKLWSEPAKFAKNEGWFKDKQFHSYLRRYKKVSQRQGTEWFYYDGHPQKSHQDFMDFRNNQKSQIKEQLTYQLRPEQVAAVHQTLDYAHNHPNSEFLWNAKPRFGKTLTTYDLARKLDAKTVLVVTNRPAVANSWFDDFEKFISWQTSYAFISTNDTLKDRPVLTIDEFNNEPFSGSKKDKMITFISLQDLKGAISFGGNYDKLKWVKDSHWDLLVIDESHEGVDTFKTDIAFNNINRDFTLNLSGTPFKAVASGKFKQNQIYNWTYADEQQAKANWHDSEKNNPYRSLPKLNLFSYQMSPMITDEVNQGAQINGDNIDYAFDLNEFFATNQNGHFIHEMDIKKWLDTLTHNEKYPFSTKELRNKLKHTFWLLNRVASAKALEKLLKEHPVFKDYEIILAAGDGHGFDDDQTINEKSLDKVKREIKKNDKTITLSVGQLTTGVTIPEWTAVLVLSNLKSPSQYMQAAFRAQNPWEHMVNGQVYQKENAYVFDFAPERTLTIYDEFANDLSKQTSNGNGTTKDREKNIGRLLNFFPVIAEDKQGKMVELNVNQVLTIPRAIKAQEVVRRGFMSNLLFANISGIFASAGAREILEQLNPVDTGKKVSHKTEKKIDTRNVKVNDKGEVEVNPEIVVAKTSAHFGEKVYGDITDKIEQASNQDINLVKLTSDTFKKKTLAAAKNIAKENGLTATTAEHIIQQHSNFLAREVQVIQKQKNIKEAQNKVDLKQAIEKSQDNPEEIAKAQTAFENRKQQIERGYKEKLTKKVADQTKQLTNQTTETLLKKAEEKKKNTVEDDIRARLRGFARTIPSFLMAYGASTTELANFDQNIKGDVFKEVTGITLDQFRSLRDTYHFFDETTFNESVQEFLRKRSQLANYFDESQDEDIFDYVPAQKTNQIFTPKRVVKLMLDKLEEEEPNIFKDKNKTFVDLYVKSGLYLTEIIKRLYIGLEDQIPESNERLTHILEKQIYGFAPSNIIYSIAKNFVFSPFPNLDNSHLKQLDMIPYAKREKRLDMKFDVVVGNPPYQETANGKSTKDVPVYNYFYDLAERVSTKYILISPARFLFNAGSTDKKWNKKMLSNKHIKVVFYEQDAAKIFPNTDIKGGIAILYRNKDKDFGNIGLFTPFEELDSISNKVSKLTYRTLDEIISNRGQYRFSDLIYKEYPNDMKKISDRRIASNAFNNLPNLFTEKEPHNKFNYIRILGRLDNQRIYRWFRRDYLQEPITFEKWKIILPKANGSGAIGEVLSTPLIGKPLIGFTETFISIGVFDNKLEAQNALKYVQSKFARTMLGILKITQDNPKDKWSKVPLQDFTQNSDIDWTKSISDIDQQLYKKYGLNQKEINFIENKVKSMN
ncbi:Eco57I restriction-modification methylase domain-containing protein [Pediococcus pentosaceus]|uniref:Eco57I restriction-modification methylase domain-containing protein n=1 Tax=Pediococcus pentosaceus TaxID=1255 RepID=UPI000E360CED|nr:Eco57I restriction-modification methylase domain-containing protein [Pediococcus pentosaceus]AXR42618.1 helicase [Pediococcus pentosaceus]AXR42629.1 helicase [Pediococcus pentosaceus]AXR42640.1 helicase [Pediococcus pentosaceus]